MSVIGSNILAGASGQGGDYTIARSLRLRSSATGHLTRTFASAGNRKTWTFSTWLKRGALGVSYARIFGGQANACHLYFVDDYLQLDLSDIGSGTALATLKTNALYRDPSAWYHIVAVCDTANGTADNRIKLYVNGVEVTSFSSRTNPSLNYESAINAANQHSLGYRTSTQGSAGIPFDGYLAEINFIDGQALTPSSFGANNASTGVWQPKKYAGTYGTNGFYLPFSDNASTTTLGNDFSGNGNNWTTNNISLTAGSTYDSMTDVPTLTSATASNFCVLNPVIRPYTVTAVETISAGNLQVSNTGSGVTGSAWGTFTVTSGKWYYEATILAAGGAIWVGYSNNVNQMALGTYSASLPSYGYTYKKDGTKCVNNTSGTSYGATYTTNDVIGVAIDLDSNTIEFFKNGTSQGVAFTSITSTGGFTAGCSVDPGTTTVAMNFGQRPFAYTPPTGFVALNTFNLPTPTIGATASTQAEKYMDISLYSGTSASGNNITDGLSLSSGGLLWVKNRNATGNHALVDSVRGITKRLISDSTNAEDTVSAITSFNSNGFTLEGSDGSFNLSGRTYVAWQWLANGTGVTNTAGSITSTVSANTSAGFSVVTYTGTGSAATIGHGLGVAPSMLIVQTRTGTNNRDKPVYHASRGNTKALVLNATIAEITSSSFWNNTSPTSTVFTVGNDQNTNQSSSTYVAYCFSEVAGYSKFGSYTGNGSTDGTFAYLGFRPKFVMIKCSTLAENWQIWDSSRPAYNSTDLQLFANSSQAESSGASRICAIDFTANGFKVRGDNTEMNRSADTYVYAAFAEVPTKFALAR
jgi:hypothetical protein